MKGSEAEKLVADQLLKKGFTDQNTLFADCSCPDEVNHDDPTEDISSIFQTRWGEMFPLAGLAGMPFTGKTGWGAFSGHCVKDGNIVILFAPHVGVSSEGLVGKLHRDGQENISSACGAAIGALAALKADKNCTNFPSGYQDHQMDCIKHLLSPHVDEIINSENEQSALVYKMYAILEQFLEDIINQNWMTEKSHLAILGGIMINCDGNKTDRFLPIKFEVRTLKGKEDLFKETFGKKR